MLLQVQVLCRAFNGTLFLNFGGLWETAVRSFKGHLRKVAGDVCLTYEELCTILTQIKVCLNS